MKVLILADPSSVHTNRWANSLDNKGIQIYVFGLEKFNHLLYNKNIIVESYNVPSKIKSKTDGSYLKLFYLFALRRIKEIITLFEPDILHAHYLSSYGFMGALTNFHPYIVSVWGSDIFNFPEKSILHRKVIKYSLQKSEKILSTSQFMALRTNEFTDKKIIVTPFGIDTKNFYLKNVNTQFEAGTIVIGTIKTLEKKYGVEYLIRAFKIVKTRLPAFKLKLLIVGGGSLEFYLKELVNNLDLNDDVFFKGYVQHNEISDYHNIIDIYSAPSIENSESFGVAVLEASACSKPVVVSNVGGLSEVVEDGKTGFVVEKENAGDLADALQKLILDPELRVRLGKNGRNKVLKEFDWQESVKTMLSVYNSFST